MLPVFSQLRFPKAGDVDDCWVVATIWAAKSVAPSIAMPDATQFREAARDPDDGVRDGGNNDEMALAVRTLWPRIPLVDFRSARWDRFLRFVRDGHVASVAVLSSSLPRNLRFGFAGAHQVGVAWDGSNLRLMNPLAREGSAPAVIAEAALRKAAFDLFGGRLMKAIVLAPLNQEATVDPNRDMPVVVADLAGGGSLYRDPDRRRVLARTWAGANDVGVYCRRNDLIAIRLDLQGGPQEDLVLAWYGADRIVGPLRVAG
jgi:hypothetical protein